MAKTKRLYRSGKDKVLGGVCGGIAEYLKVDPIVVRLVWIFGTLVSLGTGIILYIIAWIIIPRNPGDTWN
jgi:phage shock protein PspC (stress-responsive transcriptional regulator)